MKNIIFNFRVEQKVKRISEAKRYAMENKDKNKKKLKSKIMDENKEYMLLLTPQILCDGRIKFDGRTYVINKIKDKYVFQIRDDDMKNAVFFDDFEELREFAESIKSEYDAAVDYELDEYKYANSAYLRFSYYKES